MMHTEITWMNWAKSPLLPRQDKIHSFWSQAKMSVWYRITALMSPPDALESTIQNWYYMSLPNVCVEWNIMKEWHDLTIKYQGLGLPNLSIEKLSSLIQFLFRHWSLPTSLGHSLWIVYELVQIETSLKEVSYFGTINLLNFWLLPHYRRSSGNTPPALVCKSRLPMCPFHLSVLVTPLHGRNLAEIFSGWYHNINIFVVSKGFILYSMLWWMQHATRNPESDCHGE